MADKTRARDKSSIQHCRIDLPKLIDDLDMSVYAFRLYIHIKRIAEEKDGSCWESARTLASACKMSSGQVSKAKDELEQLGLITRQIKLVRGGVGDDITIVDIWPQTITRYMPESDHLTITSRKKVITTRSLSESDQVVITSTESDHTVIAETIKRSYSDPNSISTIVGVDHVVGVGDRARESLFTELRRRKISRAKALEICATPADDADILTSIDNLYDPDNPQTMGGVITLLIDAPPPKGQPYEPEQPRSLQPNVPPDRPKRPTGNGKHNPTGGADLRDPGWQDRLIAKAERGEL